MSATSAATAPAAVTGNASSLSKIQIALFFFVGFFLLPLSPLWFFVSAFYQLCLVQGTLSSHTRVVTMIVLCFFAVAWIPFVNVIFYFQAKDCVQTQIPVRINGLTPIALLVIFYVWGSVIGYRYYTIPSSYEQSRDRESVLKLKRAELHPPLRVARALAIAAQGHENSAYAGHSGGAGGEGIAGSGSGANAAAAHCVQGDQQYAYGTYDTAPPPTNKASDDAFSGAGASSANVVAGATSPIDRSRARGQTFAVLRDSMSPAASPRDGDNSMAVNQPAFEDAANNIDQQQQQAAGPDVVLIKNAYELLNLLQQETGEGANRTMLVAIVLTGIMMGIARGYEHYEQPSENYNYRPLYELSTAFAVCFFTQLFATLYFVRLLYQQSTHLVYVLTFLGRGTTDLRSDRQLFVAAEDSEEDDEEGDSQNLLSDSNGNGNNSVTGQSMHMISAAAFSSYGDSNADDNILPDADYQRAPGARSATGGATTAAAGDPYGSASSADHDPIARARAEARRISSTAAKSAIVELLDPFNPSHLSAWNEVRKLAAESIASDYSILNSFLQPTLVLAGPLAVGGLSLYLAVRILFSTGGGNPAGIFTIVTAALDLIFLVYLILIYSAAREARRHFKSHEVIIARIAFDVARDLEHAVRKRSQGTLEDGSAAAAAAAANALSSPLLQQQQQQQPVQLLANGKLSGIAHEPPRDPVVLQRLFDSVNSLCTHLQVNSPRPLFLGVRTSSAKWILVFAFVITALLLFFGLLRAQRSGECNVNATRSAFTTTTTTTMAAPAMTTLVGGSTTTGLALSTTSLTSVTLTTVAPQAPCLP